LRSGSAYEFLSRGNCSASAGPVRLLEAVGMVPAAVLGWDEQLFYSTEAFGSVAVQSVGCEEGVDDPSAIIYLTRGSIRQLRSLPEEVSGKP